VTGYFTVAAVISNTDATTVWLTLGHERLETTSGHPFFTEEDGWVKAGGLRPGDHEREADGAYGVVQAVEADAYPQVMYYLTVAGAHTFFGYSLCRWLVIPPPESEQMFQDVYTRLLCDKLLFIDRAHCGDGNVMDTNSAGAVLLRVMTVVVFWGLILAWVALSHQPRVSAVQVPAKGPRPLKPKTGDDGPRCQSPPAPNTTLLDEQRLPLSNE